MEKVYHIPTLEKELIIEAYRRNPRADLTTIAMKLGIAETTLSRKMRQHGLTVKELKPILKPNY